MFRCDPFFKKEIINITTNRLGHDCLLFIFGSMAHGKIDKLSDIDLAFYREKKITEADLVELKEELDTKVHTLRFLDLFNFTSPTLHPPLVKNILKEGILWHKPKNSAELLKSLRKRLKNIKKSSRIEKF
ncbi:MAG: nucleotidyltransferase domain-containing protein [Elusimicrobia bacterium]|nr:nucleotidyltransferase domain-containing protein [Elusimicrobiota bacterium]